MTTSTELPLVAGAAIERVASDATWSEGPVSMPASRVVRWSDIPGDRVLEYDPATGETRTRHSNVEFTNGRAHAADGTTVVCSHGRRAVERWNDVECIETIAEGWNGGRLNSPNDVALHSDGSIWFTDPDYGIRQPREGHPGEREYGGCYVFRVQGGEIAPVITDIGRPNGIAFSPDETRLYVTDTASALGDGDGHHIRVYDVDGARVVNGRMFAEVSPGVPDGIAVDVDGRVWSSSASGVQVFAPDGSRLGEIAVPETVGNLCFAEDGMLYIAASTSLYRIATTTRGAS